MSARSPQNEQMMVVALCDDHRMTRQGGASHFVSHYNMQYEWPRTACPETAV